VVTKDARPDSGTSLTLEGLLRCPKCGSKLMTADELTCPRDHKYPQLNGIPRLVAKAEDASDVEKLSTATSRAFGKQWQELGDRAAVSVDDLSLHLPRGWSLSIFSGLVLDVGCGMGRYTRLVQGLGATAVGLDLSKAVDAAKERWPKGWFVQADIMAPPFDPGTFNLVYSFGVLHHLSDPRRGFQACFRLVQPNGRILVWVYSDKRTLLRRIRRLLRSVTRRFPIITKPVAWLSVGGLLPIVAVSRLTRGKTLAFYRDKSAGQLFVDCHDALIAPLETYLTEKDCRSWLESIDASQSGFEKRGDGSGWLVWAEKGLTTHALTSPS
jgi:SAM-dependent methyltransferase